MSFIQFIRLLSGIAALAPTIASVPLPAFQIAAGIVCVISEGANIYLKSTNAPDEVAK